MSLYYIGNPEKLTLPVNCKKWECKLSEGFPLHFHKPLELIVMCRGKMNCMANDRKYTINPGDALLFNPYTIHTGTSDTEFSEYLCLTLTPSTVLNFKESVLHSCGQSLEQDTCAFEEYYPAGKENTEIICDCTKQIFRYLNDKSPSSEALVLSQLYRLLSQLLKSSYHQSTPSRQSRVNTRFMRNLADYLKENYSRNISANSAAKALFLSPSRFSHLVKQHFGTSFSVYLCNYRIIMAMNNYGNSGLPIKEISAAVGFNDYCYFSRAFKKQTGKSPAFYFGKWKNTDNKRDNN